MTVWLKEPKKAAQRLTVDGTLESLQKLVGGYIETFTLGTDVVVICNEEGRIKGLQPNCSICGVDFVGTILLAGIDGESFCDCPITVEQMEYLFPALLSGEESTWQQAMLNTFLGGR